MKKKFIPLDEPYVGIEEAYNLVSIIKQGWLSGTAPQVKEFEESFAAYHEAKFAISCMTGTAALELVLETLKIGPGDEIIIPTLTFSADAFTISKSGARVIFADVLPKKFTLDPEEVRKKITSQTKAVIPTHLYGRPANLDELKQICRENNIYLIEDCAQAQGAMYKDKKVGSIGDINIHSFHNKLIATGEGGMITTNNEEFAKRLDLLKNPAPMNITDFAEISLNRRMSNMQAVVGLAQLERLERSIARKLKMARIYDEKFSDLAGAHPVLADAWTRTVYWRYTLLLNPEIERDKVMIETKKAGFETRQAYWPLHKHPYYAEYNKMSFPYAEYMGQRALDIPSSIRLTEKQILFIADKLKAIIHSLK